MWLSSWYREESSQHLPITISTQWRDRTGLERFVPTWKEIGMAFGHVSKSDYCYPRRRHTNNAHIPDVHNKCSRYSQIHTNLDNLMSHKALYCWIKYIEIQHTLFDNMYLKNSEQFCAIENISHKNVQTVNTDFVTVRNKAEQPKIPQDHYQ